MPQRARDARESSSLPQRVADAAHRLDQPRLSAGLGLAPQVADVDVERVRREAEVVTPHAFEDDRPRQDLPRIAEEQLQQRELGPGQLDRASGTPDVTCAEVDLEVGEGQYLARTVAARGPAQERA